MDIFGPVYEKIIGFIKDAKAFCDDCDFADGKEASQDLECALLLVELLQRMSKIEVENARILGKSPSV